MVKQAFEFLYSFSFSFQNIFMFMARQAKQVRGPIIRFNTIKMVNLPTLWQHFAMHLLPNNNVLQDITPVCPRVIGNGYHSVTIISYMPSTLPTSAMPINGSIIPNIFSRTTMAIGILRPNISPTQFAFMFVSVHKSPPFKPIGILDLALRASLMIPKNICKWLTANSASYSRHKSSITHNLGSVK